MTILAPRERIRSLHGSSPADRQENRSHATGPRFAACSTAVCCPLELSYVSNYMHKSRSKQTEGETGGYHLIVPTPYTSTSIIVIPLTNGCAYPHISDAKEETVLCMRLHTDRWAGASRLKWNARLCRTLQPAGSMGNRNHFPAWGYRSDAFGVTKRNEACLREHAGEG